MSDGSHSLPDNLPGIHVAFGLKQCLGDADLLLDLLHNFWEDYSNACLRLRSTDTTSSKGELLHDIRGAATNLGLSTLSDLCLELREQLKQSGELNDDQLERFQVELEKTGGSIKTLDSFHQS
jgi:HPt (histidine-containing phosphotransfer) domain-containing protein